MIETVSKDQRVRILLRQGRHSASGLARRMGVSVITAKRIVHSLREGGVLVASVRLQGRTHYEIRNDQPWEEILQDSLLTCVIPADRAHAPRGKPEDRDYDRE